MPRLPESGQAGTSEIEITPEMIEAGCLVFRGWFARPEHFDSLVEYPGDQSVRALAEAIFCSMRAVNPISSLN
jgi:hypothetical protein